MLVTLLVLKQGKIVVHELEPTHGDQAASEGLVNITDYRKADWDYCQFFHT